MPAGCEFICQNRSCTCFNQGFNITAPWPMGHIELVLNAPNIKENVSFRNGLIRLKNEGRKFACITYPNVANIEKVAYRINMWSKNISKLFQFDIEIQPDKTLEELIAESEIPSVCTESGGDLLTFDQVCKEGILCPHCEFQLKQDRWFTNEE
jgi:hypothetical protein